MTRSRTAALALVPFLAIAALAGCSSDSSSDSSSASTCSDLQDLATEVRGLTDVNLVSEGTSGITDQIDAIEAAWTQVESSSDDQFSGQLDALKSALEGLGDTLSGASGSGQPLSEIIGQVETDVTAISTAFTDLRTSAEQELSDCDLSASSGS